MTKFKGVLLLTLLASLSSLNAATLVEMKDHQEQTQRFYIGDNMARWNTDNAGGYMLIEMSGGKVYNIDPRDRTIAVIDTVEFSGEPVKSSGKGKMTRVGAGPEIAGYSTEQYRLSAAGVHCADVYLSKSAFKVNGMREMWGVMADMAERAAAMAGSFAPAQQDPCEQADTAIMEKLTDLGMPMRSVDRDGTLESEIILISQGEKVPDGFFSLPEGYQRHDMNEQMRIIEKMNSQMPSPEQMMNMTDEDRQKMIMEIMGK